MRILGRIPKIASASGPFFFLKHPSFLFLIFFFILSPSLQAQTGWIQFFQDDFEDGNADGWLLESGWVVEVDAGNLILSGFSHAWARLQYPPNWNNFSFKLKVKLIQGTVHLNYQYSDRGRYFIGSMPTGCICRNRLGIIFLN